MLSEAREIWGRRSSWQIYESCCSSQNCASNAQTVTTFKKYFGAAIYIFSNKLIIRKSNWEASIHLLQYIDSRSKFTSKLNMKTGLQIVCVQASLVRQSFRHFRLLVICWILSNFWKKLVTSKKRDIILWSFFTCWLIFLKRMFAEVYYRVKHTLLSR